MTEENEKEFWKKVADGYSFQLFGCLLQRFGQEVLIPFLVVECGLYRMWEQWQADALNEEEAHERAYEVRRINRLIETNIEAIKAVTGGWNEASPLIIIDGIKKISERMPKLYKYAPADKDIMNQRWQNKEDDLRCGRSKEDILNSIEAAFLKKNHAKESKSIFNNAL